ncbi:hypothetical protein ABVK25_003333 [Lepraria finkii]|uniref:Uncharacterized protein n=1 Tax=Lepraria finkii TaxID=1340010 RepID=A0ABR4BF73_9LECA
MSYSGDQRGSWSEKIYIGGDSDPFFKATAGLDGLWLVSLVLVAVWAAVASSKRERNTPPTARLNKFWVTISIAIVFYAFSFGADVLVDRGAEVTASYVLAEVIFGTLAGLVDICMLVTIYYLLFRILRQTGL